MPDNVLRTHPAGAFEKKKTLMDVVTELNQLTWRVDDMDGELTEELEADLTQVEARLVDKAQAILHVVESMEAQAGVHKARAAQLNKLSKSLKGKAQGLTDWLHMNMKLAGIEKLPTPDFPKLRIKTNNPAVNIYDEEALRAYPEYWVTKPAEVSKSALAPDLKDGLEIDGANLVRRKVLAW